MFFKTVSVSGSFIESFNRRLNEANRQKSAVILSVALADLALFLIVLMLIINKRIYIAIHVVVITTINAVQYLKIELMRLF